MASAQSSPTNEAQQLKPTELVAVTRSHQNQSFPIHCLPDEILASIFCCVESPYYVLHVRDLLAFSSVCYRWRSIALECPRLWTRLEPLQRQLFELFLSRSKQALLDVKFEDCGSIAETNFQECILLALSHAHRWQTCFFGRLVRFETLASLPLESMPLLEVLTIVHTTPTSRGGGPAALLFFPIHPPRLSVLVLQGSFIPSTHPIYTGLTELTLRGIRILRPSLIQGLLHVFVASPTLLHLRLECLIFSCPIPPESIHPPTPLIHLSHLQSLYIALTPTRATRYILSRLAISPSARINFGKGNSDMLAILPSRDHIQTYLPTLSSAFALRIELTRLIRVSGCTSEHEKLFKLQLDMRQELSSIFTTLGTALPTPSLRSVSLCSSYIISATIVAAVADLLARHPDITQLAFEGCDQPMLQILLDASICPRLESLRISKCLLKADALVEIVRLRTRPKGSAAHGLRRLIAKGCPQLDSGISPVLQEYGVDVEYEGK
ncbi:hypothetical protein BOTBODRAFT_240291 [Botryobasidium botryosum FD-172 SS1]|uniref:F-box domain-containing protein n=1 Tax=Botryobasidium botryosum (strain FD-172 SS1) TaxID=930990 RepID=A0A067MQ02_BOTB1|nr:hypothetical protein BOTBODRAFT_240291 [Botryobasidium botryosum FD-172 SS1]